MAEDDPQLPLSERIKTCPIHQWADVDDYLRRAGVPPKLHDPFHELVVARGQYPWNVSDEDAGKFGHEARLITERYELIGMEGRPLAMVFFGFIRQWEAHERGKN